MTPIVMDRVASKGLRVTEALVGTLNRYDSLSPQHSALQIVSHVDSGSSIDSVQAP